MRLIHDKKKQTNAQIKWCISTSRQQNIRVHQIQQFYWSDPSSCAKMMGNPIIISLKWNLQHIVVMVMNVRFHALLAWSLSRFHTLYETQRNMFDLKCSVRSQPLLWQCVRIKRFIWALFSSISDLSFRVYRLYLPGPSRHPKRWADWLYD